MQNVWSCVVLECERRSDVATILIELRSQSCAVPFELRRHELRRCLRGIQTLIR